MLVQPANTTRFESCLNHRYKDGLLRDGLKGKCFNKINIFLIKVNCPVLLNINLKKNVSKLLL
jgi:hypothetical protein